MHNFTVVTSIESTSVVIIANILLKNHPFCQKVRIAPLTLSLYRANMMYR